MYLGILGNLCYWHLSQTILRRNSTYPLLFHQKIIETTKYHVESSTLQLKFFFDTLTKNLMWKSLYVLCTSQNSKIHLTQSAIKLVKWFVDILLKNRSKKDQVWFFASESSTHPIPNKNGNSLSKVRRIDQVHCKYFDHKNYGDWKLRGPCRENLNYLWKRAVRIAGFPCNCRVSPQFLQPFSIDSADFPCRDPAISSPRSFYGQNIWVAKACYNSRN